MRKEYPPHRSGGHYLVPRRTYLPRLPTLGYRDGHSPMTPDSADALCLRILLSYTNDNEIREKKHNTHDVHKRTQLIFIY